MSDVSYYPQDMPHPVSDTELARRKAYYRTNRERILAAAKAWRESNPKRYRDLQRANYEAHKDERRAARAAARARLEPERAAQRAAAVAKTAEWAVKHNIDLREKRRATPWQSAGNRPGFVYVLTHPKHPGLVKIGRAEDLAGRLCAYNGGCPDRAYAIDASVRVSDRKAVESRAHQLLAEAHHDGEWFRCDVATAVAAVEQAAAATVFD